MGRVITIADCHEHLEGHQDQLVLLKLAVNNGRERLIKKAPFKVVRVFLPHHFFAIMRFNQIHSNAINLISKICLVIVYPISSFWVSIRQDSKLQEVLDAICSFREMVVNLLRLSVFLCLIWCSFSQALELQNSTSVV